MRKFIICLLVLLSLMACEEQEYEFEDKYVLHCILKEGESPMVFVFNQLDPYPDFPFEIIYFNQQFLKDPHSSIVDTLKESKFCEIKLNKNGHTYSKFELMNLWLNEIETLKPKWIGVNIPFGQQSVQYFTSNQISVHSNDEYTIRVDAYKFKDYHSPKEHSATLKATTSIPSKVAMDINLSEFNIIIDTTYWGDSILYHQYTCGISFQDDPSKSDYYYILPYVVNLDSETDIHSVNIDSLWIIPNDFHNGVIQVIEANEMWGAMTRINGIKKEGDNYKGYFISDQRFNGQEKRIVLSSKEYVRNPNNRRYICFEIFHITEDFYKYYVQLAKQNSYSGYDVTSEQVQIYSNIENGLGLFAGISVTRKTVELKSE